LPWLRKEAEIEGSRGARTAFIKRIKVGALNLKGSHHLSSKAPRLGKRGGKLAMYKSDFASGCERHVVNLVAKRRGAEWGLNA